MADIKPIKPIRLCVNITIPTIDDDSISLYEAVGVLGAKLQEAIQKINESFGSLEGAYSPTNPPPYPVTSVNGQTGEVVITIPENVYTEDNPPPYPVTSVNRAETKDVITVFEPEGGDIDDVTQAELIAACKAGARLGAFDQDNLTCRLYHLSLFGDPERVRYTEIAGGGASGVTSVNEQTGTVNIFNAPISAATEESVTDLNAATNEKINRLKNDLTAEQTARESAVQALANDISDAWIPGKTYAVGDYCINENLLYKCKTDHTAGSVFEPNYWINVIVGNELSNLSGFFKIVSGGLLPNNNFNIPTEYRRIGEWIVYNFKGSPSNSPQNGSGYVFTYYNADSIQYGGQYAFINGSVYGRILLADTYGAWKSIL